MIKAIATNSFADIAATMGFGLGESGWPDTFGQRLHDWVRQQDGPDEPIRTVSLFTGVGGLDIGFHEAGFEIVESIEIERQFCETLEANSSNSRFFDSTKFNCIDIRDYATSIDGIDFVIGGPPCQTFSSAGRRVNGVLGLDDERGVLFREYIRLLGLLNPKGFLFENVYGVIGAQGGEAWGSILEGFSEIGYNLFYRVLDGADYGVPQHRERLIIIGLKEGRFAFPRPLFGPDSTDDTLFNNAQDALRTAPNDDCDMPSTTKGRYGYLLPAIPPGLNYSSYTSKLGHPSPVFSWRPKFSDFMYKADPTTPVRTIKAQGGQYTGPFHWDCRHFSIAERCLSGWTALPTTSHLDFVGESKNSPNVIKKKRGQP
jgi:DNA (cytosine-5)-methyltransferase 1